MGTFRTPLVLVAVLGLSLPAAAASAQQTASRKDRGIKISGLRLEKKDTLRVTVRWDKRDLRKAKALNVTMVATTGEVGKPVFSRSVSAKAKQPKRQYTFSLNKSRQRIVKGSDGIGVAVSQKAGMRHGLYRRAWIGRSGVFPHARNSSSTLSTASRCSPVQAGGSYSGCYYGYSDFSNMDLHGATFTDANFSFTTLQGTNFSGSDMSYAQFSYSKMQNANLTSANLTGAYLYGANMSGDTVTGTTFTYAQYCNTTTPNGSVNNANC